MTELPFYCMSFKLMISEIPKKKVEVENDKGMMYLVEGGGR